MVSVSFALISSFFFGGASVWTGLFAAVSGSIDVICVRFVKVRADRAQSGRPASQSRIQQTILQKKRIRSVFLRRLSKDKPQLVENMHFLYVFFFKYIYIYT